MHPKLQQYVELLTAANQHVNLVSRKDIEFVVEHHIQPSQYFLELERVQPGNRIVDIGSGGGFPGLVIAILEPSIQVTVVDSVRKKTNFLKSCVTQLQLPNVTIVNGRVEHLKGQYDHATARAVAPLATVYRWAKPLLKPGGTLEAMKGRAAAEREVLALPATVDYDIIPCDQENTVIVSVLK